MRIAAWERGPGEAAMWARLGAAEGVRVRRSWRVARQAVSAVGRDGRNLRLRLTNGLIAPVARNSVAGLRRLEWISQAPSAAVHQGGREIGFPSRRAWAKARP